MLVGRINELYKFTDLQDEVFFKHGIFLIQGNSY